MKKILTATILLISTITFFQSQVIAPLNNSEYDTPTNSYFKDLNNELDPYIGTWKSTFQGKTVLIKITKQLKRPYELFDKNFYKDQLIMRYEIRDSANKILESSLNNSYTNNDIKYLIQSLGTNIKGNNEVDFLFSGGNCSVGYGFIYITKANSNQLKWSYYPGTTTRIDSICPPNKDYTIYLPETEGLIFTKQ